MVGPIGLGIGAGLVSALLFALVVTGSMSGLLLCYLAPVPVVIVALGWHNLVGLLAVAVAGAALSAVVSSNAALAYALSAGGPAWGLSWLALVSRPDEGAPTGRRWIATGRLLACVAAAGAAVGLVSVMTLGRGDYAVFHETLYRLGSATLRAQLDVPKDQPLPTVAGTPGAVIVAALVRAAPAVVGAVLALVLAANLWAGAKVVHRSGRLPRPWHPIPETRMPNVTAWALAGSGLLLLGGGWIGVAGAAVFGALSMAFALQGLALVHALTRGRAGRGGLLGLLYTLVLFFGGTVLPLLGLVGLLDSLTPLRSRLAARSGGRSDPPQPPRSN